MARTLAAADIGSNTAHLLVAATDGHLVMRTDTYNEWIPLGETVTRLGQIPREQQTQLSQALREFRRMAAAKGAERLYVFATEGMRSAANHAEVRQRLSEETGIEVDIIPPEREAELSFLGTRLDAGIGGSGLVFEAGGGSLQVGAVRDGVLTDRESMPLGTGRLIAQFGLSNPCSQAAEALAERAIREALGRSSIQARTGVAVASGGVVRGLWRALHPDGEKRLHREELRYMQWSAARLTQDRIVSRFGVKPRRAGTLHPGAMIYAGLMDRFDLPEIAISEFGIREGAILEMAANRDLGQRLGAGGLK
jgi:exopolyphosphatase/guanosine-5'-triphosphate,3'-diphosphate pyrophosphatase